MAVGLVLVLAASASLLVARTGFMAVDAASQLRDNARFASDLIHRLALQAGYKDAGYAATTIRNEAGIDQDPAPNVRGFNNALPDLNRLDQAKRRSDGLNSDVLILRHQASALLTTPGNDASDRSMTDCMGFVRDTRPNDRDDMMTSVLYVAYSGKGADAEPNLMCTRSVTGRPKFDPGQPLVSGVENFQVLYGVDGVTPGAAIDPAKLASADGVPERYLRADQLTVPGDESATKANWRRVRSLRVGLILRAGPGTAQMPETENLYPFGVGRAAGTGAAGSALASASDPGTIVKPPGDTRLRQVVSFTVHLSNDQQP
jgi:type IV pilus assembly protein PilW